MKNFLSRTWQMTILFLVTGGILALAFGGYFGPISAWANRSMVSTQTWISTRYVALRDFLTVPRDVISLRRQNAELEAEVSRLQTQIVELQQQVTETQILAALVDFSHENPESSYKAAAVIGRDPSPFLHYIIINRGSSDGIREGMPVVTNQGLVGRVDAVIADAARVQLLTDPGVAVNARLQAAQTDGLVTGSVTGDLKMSMISQDASVESGDVVFTSGLGGDYPPNLLIGQVLNVRKRDYELFQEASLQSAVDFSQLEIVLVITNFRPVDITPLLPETSP